MFVLHFVRRGEGTEAGLGATKDTGDCPESGVLDVGAWGILQRHLVARPDEADTPGGLVVRELWPSKNPHNRAKKVTIN